MTRPISDVEATVVARVLADARVRDLREATKDEIRKLSVVSSCSCGCDSVNFLDEPIEHEVTEMLADAEGCAPDGDEVGIIVWGRSGRVTSLEIYNFSDKLPRLPVLDSIKRSTTEASSQKDRP